MFFFSSFYLPFPPYLGRFVRQWLLTQELQGLTNALWGLFSRIFLDFHGLGSHSQSPHSNFNCSFFV